MHCDIPSVGAQAFLQLDMPSPKPDIKVISIRVGLVQTVRVYTASGAVLVCTNENQLARFYNARVVEAEDTLNDKVDYVPRWKEGEPISVAQCIMLPTHEVSRLTEPSLRTSSQN